jgi:hypothetical protein
MVQSKFVSAHAMKAYMESTSIVPHILNLVTRHRRMVSFTPHPLYFREKELTVRTEQEVAWALE